MIFRLAAVNLRVNLKNFSFFTQIKNMYKNTKYILTLMVMLFVAGKSSAQFKLPHAQIFANLNYATPTNSVFKDAYKAGYGGEVGGGLGLGSTMLVGTLGYQTFNNTNSNVAGNLRMTTIKAGIRQYIFLGKIFLLGNLGSAKTTYSNVGTSANSLIFEYGAGVRLFGLELQATQTGWNQPIPAVDVARAFNIKLGFSFKI
jgi:hypothetical protein